jgi:hypothetical protein
MKTDKSVHVMLGVPFNPRVETRGYLELVDDRIQDNPLIHPWDLPTQPYNPLSVLTDFYQQRR